MTFLYLKFVYSVFTFLEIIFWFLSNKLYSNFQNLMWLSERRDIKIIKLKWDDCIAYPFFKYLLYEYQFKINKEILAAVNNLKPLICSHRCPIDGEFIRSSFISVVASSYNLFLNFICFIWNHEQGISAFYFFWNSRYHRS